MARESRTEVKRLSGSIPVDLYDRIKAYADKIGVSVTSAIAMICDNWLTAQDAQKILAEAEKIRTMIQDQYVQFGGK